MMFQLSSQHSGSADTLTYIYQEETPIPVQQAQPSFSRWPEMIAIWRPVALLVDTYHPLTGPLRSDQPVERPHRAARLL